MQLARPPQPNYGTTSSKNKAGGSSKGRGGRIVLPPEPNKPGSSSKGSSSPRGTQPAAAVPPGSPGASSPARAVGGAQRTTSATPRPIPGMPISRGAIPGRAPSRTYVVTNEDTFDTLSQRLYGSPDFQDLILSANPQLSSSGEPGVSTVNLTTGQTIVVPPIPGTTPGEAANQTGPTNWEDRKREEQREALNSSRRATPPGSPTRTQSPANEWSDFIGRQRDSAQGPPRATGLSDEQQSVVSRKAEAERLQQAMYDGRFADAQRYTAEAFAYFFQDGDESVLPTGMSIEMAAAVYNVFKDAVGDVSLRDFYSRLGYTLENGKYIHHPKTSSGGGPSSGGGYGYSAYGNGYYGDYGYSGGGYYNNTRSQLSALYNGLMGWKISYE